MCSMFKSNRFPSISCRQNWPQAELLSNFRSGFLGKIDLIPQWNISLVALSPCTRDARVRLQNERPSAIMKQLEQKAYRWLSGGTSADPTETIEM